MTRFSSLEMAEIDRIWRALPDDYSWSGWAAVDKEPGEIWLYRRRQNWRRFQLLKQAGQYVLTDEKGMVIASAPVLARVLCDIEIAPPLEAV